MCIKNNWSVNLLHSHQYSYDVQKYGISAAFILNSQGHWKHGAVGVDQDQRFHLDSCGIKLSSRKQKAIIKRGSEAGELNNDPQCTERLCLATK